MRTQHRKLLKPSSHRPVRKPERQEQILNAAFKVFAAHGYEAARLDDVAEQAGIAKGTIYLYFRDKEQLFREVVRSVVPAGWDALMGNFSGSAEDLLRDLVARMYRQVVRNEKVRSIVRLLIAESSSFPQLADIYHREVIGPGMNALRQVLRQGIASGEFRQTAAVEFPQILASPGVLAIVWRLLHGDRHRLDLDAYMKAHLEFVLSSVRKESV